MDAAKLVLEYLRVIFAWPPIVGAVLVLFLALQRTAVARLLDRIRRLSYPGGEMEMPHYDPQPAAAPTPEIKSAPQEGDATVTALARDFDHFLFVSVQAGMQIIMNLLDAAWRKRLLGLFGDTPPRTFSEKVEAVRASIDQRAYNDLVSISRLMSKKPLGREDLIEAHRKCQLLIDYFRGLLTRS